MAEQNQEVPPPVPPEHALHVLGSRAASAPTPAQLPRRDGLTVWDGLVDEFGNPTALERRRG